MRQPFYNIYAFCRTADDAADESPDRHVARQRIDALQRGLDTIFDSQTFDAVSEGQVSRSRTPPPPLFPALADTIVTYQLPRQPFDNLLSAFRQDQSVTQYASTPQLFDYCRRSANPVGRLVLGLAGACNEENAALSDHICTGLQLANFWQDVARDREIGRVYLPADLRQQFGVVDAMLDEDTTPSPLRRLLAHVCDQAEAQFHHGLPLCRNVPRWLSADIKLFAHGGLATLNAIRRIDYNVLRVRPTVGKFTQLSLVARTLLGKL